MSCLILGEVYPTTPAELHTFFRKIKDQGIFICTSRYETLGITPLEAILAGVPTLVPDSSRVEASCYLHDHCKYKSDPDSLLNKIVEFNQPQPEALLNFTHYALKRKIGLKAFELSLLKAIQQMHDATQLNPAKLSLRFQ